MRFLTFAPCALMLFATADVQAAKVPDLSGTYDVATLTPLRRPQAFGENLYLTKEQADAFAWE